MSHHLDTLFWVWANHCLFLLLNVEYLEEKQQVPIDLIVIGLTRPELELTIYCNREEHANHYTTDVVTNSIWKLSN
jgi:hypothetical protein